MKTLPPALAAAALLALSACQVERTPPEFYEHRDPSVVEEQEAESEIRTRLHVFAGALGRGDHDDAVAALQPRADVTVLGVDPNDGLPLRGVAGLGRALGAVRATGPVVYRQPDLVVDVGLREGQGWFATHLVLVPAGPGADGPRLLRMSGVFARDRADWRLAQLHLSRPAEPPAPDTAAAEPDSAGATAPARRDSASRAADSARAGGG